MILSIAWKNIWRNRTRSMVVILAVFLGMTGGIFSSAVMNGAAEQRVKDAIRLETSHLRISLKEFQDDGGQEFYFTHALNIMEGISKMPWCESISRRIRITSMANTASQSLPVQIIGIEPEKDSLVFLMQTTLCDSCGTYFNTNSRYPVLIGNKLAEKLKAKVKSKIVYTFQDYEGNITGSAFKVCGIFKTTNNLVNEFRVFAPLPLLTEQTGLPEDAAHEIYIRVRNGYDLKTIKAQLEKALPGFLVETWDEIDPTLGMVSGFMDMMLYLFMVIILLALGFGIVNTMTMAVLERTRELGMLAAIGMKRGRIFRMIIVETVLLTFTGAIIGMGASALLVWWTGSTGIDLTAYAGGLEAAGYAAVIYPYLDHSFFVGVSILVFVTALIASIWPARKATRMNPVEAIRMD